MQKQTIQVSLRQNGGKGASRELRRQGQIPAVVYGDKKDSFSITLCPRTFLKEMHKSGFSSRLFELEGDKIKEKCLCKKVQFDPVSDKILHVDFLRVNDKKPVKLNIALDFINRDKSTGLKQGGVLNTLRRKVEILCLPKDIPELITVDLGELGFGDSVHAQDLKLPENVSLSSEGASFSICAVVAPRVLEEETVAETVAETADDGETTTEEKPTDEKSAE